MSDQAQAAAVDLDELDRLFVNWGIFSDERGLFQSALRGLVAECRANRKVVEAARKTVDAEGWGEISASAYSALARLAVALVACESKSDAPAEGGSV